MKKLLLVVLAVFFMSGIASAATTVDIKGQIRVQPEWNNYGRGSGVLPNYFPTGAIGGAAGTKSSGNFFTDQRTRLYFNVKSNENVGAAIALEIDSFWGQSAFEVNRNGTGAGLGTDAVNIEVKYANMWFKPMDALKITAGTMTYVDDMSGVFIGGGDTAGFRFDYALSKTSSLSTGLYTFWQTQLSSAAATYNPAWKDSVYFVPITLKQQLGSGAATLFFYTIQDGTNTRNSSVALGMAGAPTYGFRPVSSPYNTAQIYYAGLNYGGKAGMVSYYLMGAYNFGTVKEVATTTIDDQKISAYALNAKVDVKLGDGKLRLAGLYVSGEDSTDKTKYKGFITGDQYAGHQTMPMLQDDLVILINNTDVMSNATFLALNPNNNGDGLQVAYAAFDYNLSNKLNAKVVAGYASADKQNSAARLGKKMGTEYNAQLAYKFDENLMIKGMGSYAPIGDYFNTATFNADAAYRIWLKFIYTF